MKGKLAQLQHFKEDFKKFVESGSIAGWVKFQTSEKAQIAVGTLILMYLIATPVFAVVANNDPFTNLFNLLKGWATGHLGMFISLLGSFISVVAFLFIHRWQVLAYGIGGSLLVGGVVGITKFFFQQGANTFGNNW